MHACTNVFRFKYFVIPGFTMRQTTVPTTAGIQFVIMIYPRHTALILPLERGSREAVP